MGRNSLTAEKKAKLNAMKKKEARRKKIKKWALPAGTLLIAAALIVIIALSGKPDLFADIEIEGYGTITVALDRKTAPRTVERFTELARNGYYDGLTFQRIIEGFMMQGGGFDKNGAYAGANLKGLVGEFSANGIRNDLKHTRGVISMARAEDMNSASGQFFIMHKDYPSMDGQYAAFGWVTEGMEIVDRICTEAKPTDNNGSIPVSERPVITHVTIREK